MDEEYQEAGGGGIYILKNGIQSGYIPPGHPKGESIRKLALDGHIIILSEPIVVPDPDKKKEPDVAALVRILKKKGVVSQSDIDGELNP